MRWYDINKIIQVKSVKIINKSVLLLLKSQLKREIYEEKLTKKISNLKMTNKVNFIYKLYDFILSIYISKIN